MTTSEYRDDLLKRQARRGLAVYVAIVIALSLPLQAVTIAADLNGGANGMLPWIGLMTALMSVPTIASLVARRARGEGFSDVSFRFGGRQARIASGYALVFPLAVGFVAYGSAWMAGLITFQLPPIGTWIALFVVMALVNVVLVSGEEIGWRGYMLTRLIDAGVPNPILVSSLIWGAWHIPLVLWAGFADGPSPVLSAVLLMLTTTSLGTLLAYLRLQTGSIWPVIVLHVAWNTIIQAGFDVAALGAQETLWVGETGILTVLTLFAATFLWIGGKGKRLPTKLQHVYANVQ